MIVCVFSSSTDRGRHREPPGHPPETPAARGLRAPLRRHQRAGHQRHAQGRLHPGGHGENAILYNAGRADLILGPIGVILANGIMGEVSPAAAAAVSGAQAVKILIPSATCGTRIAGVEECRLEDYLKRAVDLALRGGGALNRSFPALARLHARRYPLMAPQDFGKLAYQSEFGPGHMVSDPALALERLLTECRGLTPDCLHRPPEPIGGGLCRFHLEPAHLSVRGSCPWCPFSSPPPPAGTGTRAGLDERLESLLALDIPGYPAWLRDYRAEDCPALHHSEAFRSAYHPHYRVLERDYVNFLFVLLAIWPLAREAVPPWLPSTAGAAERKDQPCRPHRRALPCNVFHMDDFFLPPALRTPERLSQPGGNVDRERMLAEALLPLSRGEDVTFRPFDCHAGRLRPPVSVPFRPLTSWRAAMPSSGSGPAVRPEALPHLLPGGAAAAPAGTGGAGGPDPLPREMDPLEERYFDALRPEAESDLTVDTTGFFQDPESL